jgi:tetratricopeptide (TPR) repeat protein
MLQGLLLYEIVSIITGGMLFLVSIFALIWNIVKNKKILPVLPFFPVSIIMISWPTIQSISYDDGKIEIQKTTQELTANPSDTLLQKQLQQSVAKFDTSRAKKDPVALNSISAAYYALGEYTNASKFNNKALSINPALQDAVNLKSQINKQASLKNNFDQNVQQLSNNLAEIQAGTAASNPAAGQKIISILNATKVPAYTDEKSSLVIAKGLAAVHQNAQSMQIIDKILAANPQSQEAIQLKKDIETGKIATVQADQAQIKSLETKKFNGVIKRMPVIK